MRRNLWVALAVLATLVAAALAWRLLELQPQQRVVQGKSYTGEARHNPFYAAARLLQRLGLETRSVASLPSSRQLGNDDLLVLNQPSFTLGEAQLAELLAWVYRGGRLLLAVSQDYHRIESERGDALQTALGLQPRRRPQSGGIVSAERDGRRFRLQTHGDLDLFDPERRAARALRVAGRTLALSYRHGAGQIIVYSDLGRFYNERLAIADHADLLWTEVSEFGPPATVWLQYSPGVPGLLYLLWRYGWPLLIALAVTLAAVIWAGGRRFGPLLQPPPPKARSLLEHLRAAGRFQSRHGERDALLQAARGRCHQALARRYPDWPRLDDEARLQRLAALSGLPRADLAAALFPTSPTPELVKTVRILQRIDIRLETQLRAKHHR